MRLLEAILLALSIVTVQTKAIDKDQTRIWIKRQYTPTNSTDDGASCVKETVTETLRETVTVKDLIGVTIAASSAGGDVNANKFEGLGLSTITETETEAISAPIATVTETLTIAGEAVAPVTITQTVQGTCQSSAASIVQDAPIAQSSSVSPFGLANGNGVGVSTVPIPESALPTTTFAFDPLAPSSQIEFPAFPEIQSSSSVVSNTPAVTSEVASSELAEDTTLLAESSAMTSSSASVMSKPVSATDAVSEPSNTVSASAKDAPSPSSVENTTTTTEASSVKDATTATSSTTVIVTSPSPAIPTNPAASLNLGAVAPDTTAKTATAVSQDSQAILGSALILPQLNVSTLTFSSALELGNLMGLVVTAIPTVAAQAEVYPTQRVSSMTLKMLG